MTVPAAGPEEEAGAKAAAWGSVGASDAITVSGPGRPGAKEDEKTRAAAGNGGPTEVEVGGLAASAGGGVDPWVCASSGGVYAVGTGAGAADAGGDDAEGTEAAAKARPRG